MKKFFAICLTLAMLLGMLPMTVSATEEATPIGSVDEITDLSGSYVLTQDITVTAPIGTFSGSFDGAGYTVTVNITATTSKTGMFSTIASGAEVKNFKIVDSSVTSSSYEYTGLVAGINNGTVSDITVENSTVDGYTTVGGLVGSNTGTVTRCAFESGTVKKGSSNDTSFGGIVGQNSGTVTLCSNGATMDHSNGRSNYDYTGGIVGKNQYSGKVTDCYNFGTLDDETNKSYRIGGVVGDNSGSVTNCLNVGTISTSAYSLNAVASSATNSYYLEGCGATSGGTAKTAEELATLAATLGENWVDGSDGYPVLAWQTWKYSNTAIKYTVEYYTETLEEGIYELNSSVQVKAEPDTSVTADAPAIEGFIFDEANENNVLSGSASAELVLKCYYSRNSYTLSWDVGEGTITSEEGTYTAGSVKYGAAVTYPEVSNPGYTVSWSESLETMPAADTTVTANWKTAVYPVTWDANGGQFETEDSWGDVTTSATLVWSSNAGTSCGAIYGQTLGEYRWSETSTSYSARSLPVPIHDTMVFGGWYTAAEGGEEVTAETVVTIPESGSFSYYAHWEEAWTVTFDTNGGYTSDDKTVLVGKGMTFGTAGSIPTATKSGHTLAGWFDADGNQLSADTVINGDVTYTAQWTPNTYTVTFYSNGGTGSMEPQTFTYGVPQNISKNLFTREGYRFLGWGAWSSATSVNYTDEEEYSIGASNQSFYAIWEEVRYNLTLSVTPEGAEVVVKNANGITQTASDGVYNLQEGTYTYTATLYGYETAEGTVELTEDTVLDIALVKIPTYNVSFSVTKPAEGGDTVITITNADGMEMTPSVDGSFDLIPGTYSYVVSAAGCSKAKAEFTITDSDLSFDIELVISFAWDGSTKTEPKTITAEEATGEYEGMEGWYLITSGEELAWFADQINTTSSGYTGNAVLAKDIDLGDELWTPMGYSWNYYFNGTFDGNGHAIKGLYCNGADYQALFGYSKGTIKNVTIYGEVNGTGSYVGGIVAYQNGGSILNCGSYVNVTSTNTTGRNAGIAGYLYGTTVDSCFNAGTITGSKYQGGIAGYVYGTTNITNCYNVGALVAGEVSESSGNYAASAGIFAYTSDYATVTVENCYNAGDLSQGNTRIGAIAGEVGESTTITNSYYLNDVSKSVAYGSPASDASVAKTAEELKSAEMLTTLGESYKADGTDVQSINNGYPILTWQTLPEVVEEPETMKIYFQNNWLWTNVNLYYWYADNSYDYAWPGAAMEYYGNDGTYDVYVLEIPVDVAGIVINGTKNDGSGANDQTPDITSGWYDGICYYMTWNDGNGTGSEPIDVILPPPCEHNYESVVTAPNCTEGGYTTYTCSVCGDTYTADETAALGHSYETVVTEPTCTEGGYTTYTCSVCGDTYTADETEATGHSYNYTNNGDDHTVTCANCDYSATEAHTYENGVCVCGAVEEVKPDASLLVFKNKTLSLQSYIALNVTVEAAVLADYDSWYVTFERYDHLTGSTVTETVEGVNYSTDRQLFEYKVSSYQMTDEITVTVYGVKDGVTYKGEVYTESVENFVLTRMEAAAAASTDMATLYANLLAYGSKAQTYLGYNTAALADANLGDYASYVTTTAPTAEDLSAETSNGLTGATKDRLALGIAASVQIQLRIVLDSAYDVNNIYGELSYERNGETVTQRIEGADFTISGSKYILIFDAITAVDGRAPVSITIYDANGTAISETWTYSISSYLVNGGLTGNALATMEALLNYFDAAAKVFS